MEQRQTTGPVLTVARASITLATRGYLMAALQAADEAMGVVSGVYEKALTRASNTTSEAPRRYFNVLIPTTAHTIYPVAIWTDGA